MDTPKRIQLKRTKGWRKPEGAVVVSRPSRFGNPYEVGKMPNGRGWRTIGNGRACWSADDSQPWTKREAAECAVEQFRAWFRPGSIIARDAEIQLAGRDLACWCALDLPCHADVLLEIANQVALEQETPNG